MRLSIGHVGRSGVASARERSTTPAASVKPAGQATRKVFTW